MIPHFLLLVVSFNSAEPSAPVAKLVFAKPGDVAAVEITGVSKDALAAIHATKPTAVELASACRLVVGEGKPEEIAARPGVAGAWSLTATAIRFEPQFPLVPGVKYRIVCAPAKLPRIAGKADPFDIPFAIPKPPPGPPTTIAAVYPSASQLPENTLRLYVHFSGQMTHGDIYRHVKLVRGDGKEVLRPFLEIDEELWSVDGLRVTFLFHPGRVKRGLVPREEEGPILEEGRRYTLTISRDWKDGEGRPLVADVEKTFTTGPPDDEVIDPQAWTLIPPRAGSDAPAIIRLAKPLDRALLASTVWVVDAAGKRVPGETTVGGGERVLTFAPAKPWDRGDYRLVVDTRLEDVCGNRVGEPFEVDVFRPIERKIEVKTVERVFRVR